MGAEGGREVRKPSAFAPAVREWCVLLLPPYRSEHVLSACLGEENEAIGLARQNKTLIGLCVCVAREETRDQQDNLQP